MFLSVLYPLSFEAFIALFAVTDGWLFLDIGWFDFFSYIFILNIHVSLFFYFIHIIATFMICKRILSVVSCKTVFQQSQKNFGLHTELLL